MSFPQTQPQDRKKRFLTDAKTLPGYQGWADQDVEANIQEVFSSGDEKRRLRLLGDMTKLPGYAGWEPKEIETNVLDVVRPVPVGAITPPEQPFQAAASESTAPPSVRSLQQTIADQEALGEQKRIANLADEMEIVSASWDFKENPEKQKYFAELQSQFKQFPKERIESALKAELVERTKKLSRRKLEEIETERKGQPLGLAGGTGLGPNVAPQFSKTESLRNLASNYLKQAIEVPNKSEDEINDFAKGALSAMRAENIPFIGGLAEAANLLKVKDIAEKKDKTPDEQRVLDSYAAMEQVKQNSELTPLLYEIGKGTTEMIPYAVEFAATGGVYTGAKVAAKKGITKILGEAATKKVMEQIAKKTLASRALEAAAKAGISVTAGTVQSIANPIRIAEDFERRTIPEMGLALSPAGEVLKRRTQGNPDTELKSFLKSLGVNAAEFVSERFGILVEKPVDFIVNKAVGRFLAKRGVSAADETLSKISQAVQWNGVLGEFFEEYANFPIQSTIEKGEAELMPAKEAIKTLGIVAVPGIGGKVIREAGRYRVSEPFETVHEVKPEEETKRPAAEPTAEKPAEPKPKRIPANPQAVFALKKLNEEFQQARVTGKPFNVSSIYTEKNAEVFGSDKELTAKLNQLADDAKRHNRLVRREGLKKEGEARKAGLDISMLQKIIEGAGGTFKGIANAGKLVNFDDPTTGSTMSMRPEEITSVEAVQEHIAKSRETFKVEKPPAVSPAQEKKEPLITTEEPVAPEIDETERIQRGLKAQREAQEKPPTLPPVEAKKPEPTVTAAAIEKPPTAPQTERKQAVIEAQIGQEIEYTNPETGEKLKAEILSLDTKGKPYGVRVGGETKAFPKGAEFTIILKKPSPTKGKTKYSGLDESEFPILSQVGKGSIVPEWTIDKSGKPKIREEYLEIDPYPLDKTKPTVDEIQRFGQKPGKSGIDQLAANMGFEDGEKFRQELLGELERHAKRQKEQKEVTPKLSRQEVRESATELDELRGTADFLDFFNRADRDVQQEYLRRHDAELVDISSLKPGDKVTMAGETFTVNDTGEFTNPIRLENDITVVPEPGQKLPAEEVSKARPGAIQKEVTGKREKKATGERVRESQINQPIAFPELDAEVIIEKYDPKRDKDEIARGFLYKGRLSYPVSLGEMGNYAEVLEFKELPTKAKLREEVVDELKDQIKQLREEGMVTDDIYAPSGRDENILEALEKIPELNESFEARKKNLLNQLDKVARQAEEEGKPEVLKQARSAYKLYLRELKEGDEVSVKNLERTIANLSSKLGEGIFAKPIVPINREQVQKRLRETLTARKASEEEVEAAIAVTDAYVNYLRSDNPSLSVDDAYAKMFAGATTEAAPDQALFQYIGQNANLAEDIRTNLHYARYLESQGKDAGPGSKVQLATGWFRNPYDNMWRYEIQSGNVILKKPLGEFVEKPVSYYKLSEVLDYPELYEAYPQTKDIQLVVSPFMSGETLAAFDATNAAITVNSHRITIQEEDLKKSVLHEIQHAIQYLEGFARGGNLSKFLPDSYRKLSEGQKKLLSQLSTLQDRYKRETDIDRASELEKKIMRLQIDHNRVNKQLIKFQNEAVNKYLRLAGEIEARDVEARLKLTPEERKTVKPLSSENISPDQAIVLFGEAFEEESRKAVTQTPEFKEWFGNSKVVDEQGNPLIVYHGTVQSFDRFARETRGRQTEARSAKQAFFFTNVADVAAGYTDLGGGRLADQLKAKMEAAERKAQRTGKNSDWNSYSDFVRQYEEAEYQNREESTGYNLGANLMPTYLSIKNPLVYDFRGSEYREESYNDLIARAKREGRDGVIFKNTYDPGTFQHVESDVYAVFNETQIKSATGNRGTFDPNDPNITLSYKKPEALTAEEEASLKESLSGLLEKKKNLQAQYDFAKSQPHDKPAGKERRETTMRNRFGRPVPVTEVVNLTYGRKARALRIEIGQVQNEIEGIESQLEARDRGAKPQEEIFGGLREKPGQQTLFQEDTRPANWYYSGLQRILESKMPNKASSEQIRAIIRDAKKEEVEWTGLDEFLNTKPTFTKDEVLSFLKENEVRVEEVVKGGSYTEGRRSEIITKMIDIDDELNDAGYHTERPSDGVPGEFNVLNNEDDSLAKEDELQERLKRRLGEYEELDKELDQISRESYSIVRDPRPGTTGWRVLNPEGDILAQVPSRMAGETWIENKERQEPRMTKFSQYVLPGAKEGTYRELLLTLPVEQAAKPSWTAKYVGEQGDGWKAYDIFDEAGAWIARTNGYNKEEALSKVSVPKDARVFTGGHFEEPNVFAHIRFNERTDSEGKKILFIEELQSDWAQKGRKEGYGSNQSEALKQMHDVERRRTEWLQKEGQMDSVEWERQMSVLDREQEVADDRVEELGGSVPQLPFSKNWHEVAFRRAVRWASENGFDSVGWTTGEQQADRYDLSKQVNSIDVRQSKTEEGRREVTINLKDSQAIGLSIDAEGKVLSSTQTAFNDKNLSDVVGKDIADKILAGEGKPGRKLSDMDAAGANNMGPAMWEALTDSQREKFRKLAEKKLGTKAPPNEETRTLSGVDLKVGGEGMKGFYDKIIVDYANKFGKKFGSRVQDVSLGPKGKIRIQSEPEGYYTAWIGGEQFRGAYGTRELARQEATLAAGKGLTVHSLPITREMRDSAMRGFPLFQQKKGAVQFLADGRAIIHAFESADVSTLMHELGHIFRRHLKPQDLKIAEDWVGVKEGKWTREAEEKFARGFERYLAEGKAPTEQLKDVFEKFRLWLMDIYEGITGSEIDIQLSPQVKDLFDRMLGKQSNEEALSVLYQEDTREPIAPTKAQNDLYVHNLIEELQKQKKSRKIGQRRPPVVALMKDALGVYVLEGAAKGLRGARLIEYVRGGLVKTLRDSEEYKSYSASGRLQAAKRLETENVERWIKFYIKQQRKQEAQKEIDARNERIATEAARRLVSEKLPQEMTEKSLRLSQKYRTNRDTQGKFFSRFWSRLKVMAESYGAAGGELANRMYDGDIERGALMEAGNRYLDKIKEVYDKFKPDDPYRDDISEEVVRALEDRANAQKYLKLEESKAVYKEAKEMLDYFKKLLDQKGYLTTDDYFTHILDVDIIDQVLRDIEDPSTAKGKPLNDFITAISAFLKPRKGADIRIRKDVPSVLSSYLRSVTRELAYRDGVQYYYERFQKDIPVALQRNSMDRAKSFMKNVLEPERGKGKFFRAINFIRNQQYRNFLGMNLKASAQNMTQSEFARFRWSREADKLRKKIYRERDMLTGALADAVDVASQETPRYLELIREEESVGASQLSELFNRIDTFQKSEGRNWGIVELGSILNSAMKDPRYQALKKERGQMSAIQEVLSNKEAFDKAVREAASTAAETQVASAPSMRGEFYDKPLSRVIGMFTAFKFRQLQILGEALKDQKGISGTRAQLILRKGLAGEIEPVEVLREVEGNRVAMEKMLAVSKKYNRNLGVSYDGVQQVIDHLKTQEAELNEIIGKLEPTKGKARAIAQLARYYAKITAISMFFSILWDVVDAAAGGDEDEDELLTQALKRAFFDILPTPFYGTNPAKFLVSPVAPSLEGAFPYGQFSGRGLTRNVVSYGFNVVPFAGIIDRATGRRLSRFLIDTISPKKNEPGKKRSLLGGSSKSNRRSLVE